MTVLAEWYASHGRHELAWRRTRDPWAILVSEVMLQQTQVSRVVAAWPAFMARFPTPVVTAASAPGDVIQAWGRLGYPRRARRVWETSRVITATGWPEDLRVLPGIGAYTAPAVAAQAWDRDETAADVNITRVASRCTGFSLSPPAAALASRVIAEPLRGRDRLLALMDLGATVCTKRSPACNVCPLFTGCATRGRLPDEPVSRQPRYEGSFRQRRGLVMTSLRAGPANVAGLDGDALNSLVADGLAVVDDGAEKARLP